MQWEGIAPLVFGGSGGDSNPGIVQRQSVPLPRARTGGLTGQPAAPVGRQDGEWCDPEQPEGIEDVVRKHP